MEQGFGDIIMFARFLPALKALGARKVILFQESSLHYLLGQMECVDRCTNEVNDVHASMSNYWIGSISLPYYISLMHPSIKCLFPVNKDKIVGSEGYLHAIPSNIPSKIGVNWEASKQLLYYVKSVDMREMEKLTGSDCYSLNPNTEGIFNALPNDGWQKDWLKTASHMKACKGIVTVDTGTAHLAGALGIKTIVLLPKEEFVCWRWKNTRWYDSVVCLRPDEYDQVPDLIRRM
jgi:hypothetical protein